MWVSVVRFIEFLVLEETADGTGGDRIVWSSGRTNELGVLLGGDGQPLDSEFFSEHPETGEQCCQIHHEVIDSPEKVQIYETLLHSAKHRYSTSFIHGSNVVKDNRLLPRGWKAEGPGPALNGEFLKATHPGPVAKKDARYQDGSGSDEVVYRVKLPSWRRPCKTKSPSHTLLSSDSSLFPAESLRDCT